MYLDLTANPQFSVPYKFVATCILKFQLCNVLNTVDPFTSYRGPYEGSILVHTVHPNILKRSFCHQGKKLPPPKPDTTVNGDDDGGDVSDEDEAAEMADTNEEVKKEVSSKKKKKIKLSKHLSDLVVLCKAVHFNSFEHSAQNRKNYFQHFF